MPTRYDRRRATVLAFDTPDWIPPATVVLDTSVVAEALLHDEPEHVACDAVLQRFAATGTAVVFNRLLEIELWEVVFTHAVRRQVPRKHVRNARFGGDVRAAAAGALRRSMQAWNELLAALDWQCIELHEVADAVPDLMRSYGLQSYDAVHAATLLASGANDLVSRDAGFAVLMPEDARLHTTTARLRGARARRTRSATARTAAGAAAAATTR